MFKFFSVLIFMLPASIALTEPPAGGVLGDEREVVIGVAGDSISDEYSSPFGGPFLGYEGYEWGSVLVQLRNVSFGAYSDMLTPFGQTVGYAYNHALKGQAVAPQGVIFTQPFERPVYNTFDIFELFDSPIGESGQRLQEQGRALAWNFALREIDVAVLQGGANDLVPPGDPRSGPRQKCDGGNDRSALSGHCVSAVPGRISVASRDAVHDRAGRANPPCCATDCC